MSDQSSWWKGASIYQIYLRSFYDSNHDGVGDIPGATEKLNYIASLGVDAVWLSPFFKSPMKDFGYDISHYREVDPLFGTMDDLDKFIAQAHALNLKVIIDQVLSHTSDQHAWFNQSRQDRDNAKADWYVWADPKADGSPPNNWVSIFGGVAWQWESRRQQYYLHNFLKEQPDLNFHNREVQDQILEEVEFWLKKGIDGLRLDAINFCFHDKQLRDNPAKPASERAGRGFSEDNPYAYQYHYFNNTQPENIQFIKRLRQLLDRYPGTMSLGEISSEDSLATMIEYSHGQDKLHMAYSFELLIDEFSAQHIRQTVEKFEAAAKQHAYHSWPCWAFSNHDVTRVASRWGGDKPNASLSKMLIALIGTIKGSYCVYQGEELGLTEAELEFDDLVDPFGINFWPTFKGRDGCRTPMPWSASVKHLGLTAAEVKPWLPISPEHAKYSIAESESESDSVLNWFKTFQVWRKAYPALIQGDIEFIDVANAQDVLVIKRQKDEQTLVGVFNLSNENTNVLLDKLATLAPIEINAFNEIEYDDTSKSVTMPAFGFGLFHLAA